MTTSDQQADYQHQLACQDWIAGEAKDQVAQRAAGGQADEADQPRDCRREAHAGDAEVSRRDASVECELELTDGLADMLKAASRLILP